MNYSFLIPTLLILVVIMGYYFFRPRLPIRLNRAFLAILVISIFTEIFEAVSARLNETWTEHPPWLLYTFGVLFLFFYISRAYMFFVFSISVLDADNIPRSKLPRYTPVVFFAFTIVTVISPFTGFMFYVDNGFHTGPMYYLLYACSAAYDCSNKPKWHTLLLRLSILFHIEVIAKVFFRVIHLVYRKINLFLNSCDISCFIFIRNRCCNYIAVFISHSTFYGTVYRTSSTWLYLSKEGISTSNISILKSYRYIVKVCLTLIKNVKCNIALLIKTYGSRHNLCITCVHFSFLIYRNRNIGRSGKRILIRIFIGCIYSYDIWLLCKVIPSCHLNIKFCRCSGSYT